MPLSCLRVFCFLLHAFFCFSNPPIQLAPVLFLSSKTPYYPQQMWSSYEALPKHCSLVHVNHLSRHGSRHSTKLKAPLHLYDALAEALRMGKLKPRGVTLLQSIARFTEAEGTKLGKAPHFRSFLLSLLSSHALYMSA